MICRKVYLVALLGVGMLPVWAADVGPAVAAGPGNFDGRIKNSPFGSAAAPGVQPGSDGSGLEFRGVFVDKGEPYFSLHDSATRLSLWVGLKESGQPYFVESYDIEKGSIQVKHRNQVTTLALKRSQVVVQAMPVPAPTPNNQAVSATPAIAGNQNLTDNATRMAQVAEEIRRRRALRTPSSPAPATGANLTPAINPPTTATSSRP